MKLSKRARMAPFHAMDVLATAVAAEAAGRRILHLEVGEPGTGAPRAAREAAARALSEAAPLGYTTGLGRADLRAAIARLYGARHGIELPPDRVVVTSGSSAAFSLAFLALFDPGDRVALGEPGYPCYRNILSGLGVVPVGIPTGPETRFQPTPALLDRAGPLDGLLIASPANPTGTVLDTAALAALAAWCRERNAAFVSDEIYHGIGFGAPVETALAHSEEAIVINSFSKYWGMTGWRIGWMVVPERMVRPVETLAQNLFICAPHVSQIAALGALSAEGEAEAAAHVPRYARNRDRVIETLGRLGFREIAPADGAFYAYARLPEATGDSSGFCAAFLAEEGVAITPGLDFDPVRGAETVRFSLAGAEDAVAEAMLRLERFLTRP
ncbi:MAG: pyridoxal phosphate-dependent aminotransferase [Paracoccaceae bacterium]